MFLLWALREYVKYLFSKWNGWQKHKGLVGNSLDSFRLGFWWKQIWMNGWLDAIQALFGPTGVYLSTLQMWHKAVALRAVAVARSFSFSAQSLHLCGPVSFPSMLLSRCNVTPEYKVTLQSSEVMFALPCLGKCCTRMQDALMCMHVCAWSVLVRGVASLLAINSLCAGLFIYRVRGWKVQRCLYIPGTGVVILIPILHLSEKMIR